MNSAASRPPEGARGLVLGPGGVRFGLATSVVACGVGLGGPFGVVSGPAGRGGFWRIMVHIYMAAAHVRGARPGPHGARTMHIYVYSLVGYHYMYTYSRLPVTGW
jgi:hypothetical protein